MHVAAKSILEAAHAAWSKGDIEGVLSCYVDDLTYWCNTGGPDGGPLLIKGKGDFRAFLLWMQGTEGYSVVEYFRFSDGIGRAQINAVIRHKLTGHKLAGSYRQVVTSGATGSLDLRNTTMRRVWRRSGASSPANP